MGLHKSLLRSLTVQTDMPEFDHFPKADQVSLVAKQVRQKGLVFLSLSPQVTCKYYFGLLAFLSEDWSKVRVFLECFFLIYP